MYFEISGEVYKMLLQTNEGVWCISYEKPAAPFFVTETVVCKYKKVEKPRNHFAQLPVTEAQKSRMELIQPLIDREPESITNSEIRKAMAAEIAGNNGTTSRRVLSLYYTFLAKGTVRITKTIRKKGSSKKQADFKWAIDTYYFSAKQMPLRMAYDLMLTERYMTDGKLDEDAPTWESFRHFYYDRGYHKLVRKTISRKGFTSYQRNHRILTGSAMGWKDKIGSYQMDATEADIYLVSRFDRSAVIGRPYIYLAVDTVTQLITGVYVGLKGGDDAVVACLANAAEDKVAFCKRYGIEITEEQWPCKGLPGEIITDQGKEFVGSRVDEMCKVYGMEREALPPFRPDCKGLVEKSFDMIQKKYKPLLRNKGVIEPDAAERWSIDYRRQAVLDLNEFTRVILNCVIYLNSYRVLNDFELNSEMLADEVEPIPANLWIWYEQMGRSNLIPVDQEELYLMTLKRTQSKITRKGLEHEGLFYMPKDYIKIVQRHGLRKEVTIGYDTDNTSYIYLIEDGEYVQAPLSPASSEYRQLSEEEYHLLKSKSQSIKRNLQKKEAEGRVMLLKNINDIAGHAVMEEKTKQDTDDILLNRAREEEMRS